MAGISLARRTVAAAFDAFGGWCFVDGEVLAVQVAGRLAVESEMGQNRLAGLDARNVKNQDLTPNTRCQAPRAEPFARRGDPHAAAGLFICQERTWLVLATRHSGFAAYDSQSSL
jgi:hypothetical protein